MNSEKCRRLNVYWMGLRFLTLQISRTSIFCFISINVDQNLIINLKNILNCSYSGFAICDALRDLVPLVQLKKRQKHPWRSVTFSKVTGFSLKLIDWLKIYKIENLKNGTWFNTKIVKLPKDYILHVINC